MRAKSIFNWQNLFYGLIFCITSAVGSSALAQATNQAIYLPPRTSSQGALPPPGSGPTSAPVTPGDSQREDVPSGLITADPRYGTNLQYDTAKRRSRINLMMNGNVVLTFQPDQLTNTQKGKVMGILGAGVNSAPYQNMTVTQNQLIQMQNALAPSPNLNAGISDVPMPDGRQRSQIFTDRPAGNTLAINGTNGITPKKLPVIQKFCRYLVILGVVCACIFMSFASISLIFGDRSAAGRIVGSAGGIMLLLMGYAIWKVVRVNEDNARGPLNRVVIGQQLPLQSRSSPGDVKRVKSDDSFVSTTDANLPVTPVNPGGIQRSGLPLQPLGAAH